MGVRSKRLCDPTFVSQTGELLYTCPAGETALVKTVVMINTGSATGNLRLCLNGTGANHRQLAGTGLVINTPVVFDTWLVLHPGDQLFGHSNQATTSGYITLHGTELEGVAD